MSDASGVYEVVVFAEILAQARQLLDQAIPLLVTVDVRAEEESLRLTAQRFERLDTVATEAAAGLKIVLAEGGALASLRDLIMRENGGRGRVSVVVPVSEAREVEIALPGGFKIGPGVLHAVRALPGVIEAQDV
jgi:DNA polymerase-3 subunit alpha